MKHITIQQVILFLLIEEFLAARESFERYESDSLTENFSVVLEAYRGTWRIFKVIKSVKR